MQKGKHWVLVVRVFVFFMNHACLLTAEQVLLLGNVVCTPAPLHLIFS